MKKLIVAVTLMASAGLLAEGTPEVSGVTMAQNADGLVTVTYTLMNAPAIVTLDIGTGEDEASWQSIGGEQVCRTLPGSDVWKKVPDDGTHTITLRLDRETTLGKTLKAKVSAWSLDDPPDYMVVGITTTDASKTNDFEFYPAADFLPGGVIRNTRYRNLALTMRRIHAKDVTWTMGTADSGNTVKLDADYYIGVFPVTQGQFHRVAGTNSAFFAAIGDRAMRPIENISYNKVKLLDVVTGGGATGNYLQPEAVNPNSFLGKLRTLTGDRLDFTLPSEAQWEFAARAGHEAAGYWGNGVKVSAETIPGRYAGNGGLTDGANDPDGRWLADEGGTPIVGSFGANDFGLYDMHGGVWEMCVDWYQGDITALHGATNIRREPVEGSTNPGLFTLDGTGGSMRVLRGGCSGSDWDKCRALNRWYCAGGTASYWYGFRVCCPVTIQ